MNGEEKISIMRHSTSHIMAAAVMSLWPDVKLGIGPAIDDGFYYDFDLGDTKISEEDFPKIEKEMRKLISAKLDFVKEEKSIEDAIKWAKKANQPYKLELLEDLKQEGTTRAKELDSKMLSIELPAGIAGVTRPEVQSVVDASFFTCGDFTDLCSGPHVKNTNSVGAFKLMRVAGAYWRGDEKNPQLQRIYGVAFETQAELDEYLARMEEAKKRDHRKIGKEMELYFINDEMVGKGLVMWLPNGTIIRDQIENLAREKEKEYGYLRVVSPHLAKEKLYLTSGHLPYYKDDMYPAMVMDDGTYYLKAMNCPHHHCMFQFKDRTYRDMPIRLAEYGMCYRNELSGTLAGLLRVRGLAMNDAHIYCTKNQIEDEFRSVLKLTKEYFDLFELKDYWFRLSKWNPEHTEKYIDEPENWEFTENILRKVLESEKLPFQEADDEAAFYGPKVDIQFKTVTGREETMSTIQLDFAAKKRFGLKYIDETGAENNEVFVIHRAPLSVHERLLAFLVEHYAGKFPVWLAPEQLRLIKVKDSPEIDKFAGEVITMAKKNGVRAVLDDSNNSVGKKIRNAEIAKVPYSVVLGEKEVASGKLPVRIRSDINEKGNEAEYEPKDLIDKIVDEIRLRTTKSTL